MDNSYYTGATLIRAGTTNNNGGNLSSKYLNSTSSPSTSPPSCHLPTTNLAGPPLLMQPNLLTGLPLIRNGQQSGNGPGSQPPCGSHLSHQHQHQHPQLPPPPPGLICCFQPVYYIPATSQSPIYTTPSILVNANSNNLNKLNHNHNSNTGNGKSHQQAPKRKNYKTPTPPSQLKCNKPIKNPPLQLNSSEPINHYYHHPKLSASASFPDPISPPAKQPAYIHHQITRTTSNHFFASSLESTKSKLLQNEEKQRNDKLLNFYFYDKHWRPRDETDEFENSESCQQDNDRSWDFVHQKSSLLSQEQEQQASSSSSSTNSTPTFDKQPGAGRNQFSPSPQNILKQQQQKDLEVDAQIITLANGHRDLEIRLCYVTS